MKRKRTIFYLLMVLPFSITLFVLPSLPEQIPAHYNLHNQVTRWGSKYETLILPGVTFIFGAFMLGVARLSLKKEHNANNNEKVIMTTGIMSLILFNVMNAYFLYIGAQRIINMENMFIDIYQITFGLLGVLMVVIGNIMPKLRLNSTIGLRTRWSMKNEVTWRKSQKFGGATFMISGILILLVCVFTKGTVCAAISMLLLIASLPIDTYYTYRIAKKN